MRLMHMKYTIFYDKTDDRKIQFQTQTKKKKNLAI